MVTKKENTIKSKIRNGTYKQKKKYKGENAKKVENGETQEKENAKSAKNGRTKVRASSYDEEIVKKTNILVIKKRGMNTVLKSLCRDLAGMFSPFCLCFFVKREKYMIELNKKLKELNYKFTIFTHVQNGKLFYRITSNFTKLSLTFIIKSFTTTQVIKAAYSNKIDYDLYNSKPLLILKNFNSTKNAEMLNYLVIVQNILKTLYPSVNLREDFTKKHRRVLLYYYNSEDETIHFRQYITNVQVRTFKKIMDEAYKKKNSDQCSDMYNYISNQLVSEDFKSNEEKNLTEIGPRVCFKIYKIADQDKGKPKRIYPINCT
ncbi:BRIX domain, putative [Plasmodium ovale wallikeri]|uniref:BRIX domain, putative n=2 Tax=Plasmodium ovale TaxID=36330 RepID=A0A1A8YME2_PLAOA|nr:BRIX domain, putative [Plasmodium ovale wallikeri]SBT32756.1 BRIX domain, putative [Plasmodium ovale wallikeri]SBT75877.1 BRIX domain, putative [Plasmodium ovale]